MKYTPGKMSEAAAKPCNVSVVAYTGTDLRIAQTPAGGAVIKMCGVAPFVAMLRVVRPAGAVN